MEKEAARKSHFDLLKILAIVFVLFQHTGQKGYLYFIHARNSLFLYPSILISLFSKIAVPVFFMCSGALLLGKNESLSTLFKKRIARFFAVLAVCSVIMYIEEGLTAGDPLSFSEFFRLFHSKGVIVPYWYLYSYLGFLFMLPFLRKIAQSFDETSGWYLLACFGLLQVLNLLGFLIWKQDVSRNSDFAMMISHRNTVYPLIGYYIDRCLKPEEITRKKRLAAVGISLLSMILIAVLTVYRCDTLNNWSNSSTEHYFNTLAFIPSVTVFYLAKYAASRSHLSGKAKDLLQVLSSLTFGIYLFETVFRKAAAPVYRILSRFLPAYLACWMWVFASVILGEAVIYILKKFIKPLNRFI